VWRKILHFVAIPPTTVNFISKINKLINGPQFAYIELEALLSIMDARALLANRIKEPKIDIQAASSPKQSKFSFTGASIIFCIGAATLEGC